MSGARRSLSASRATRPKSVNNDEEQNLEDVLIAKYLDELRKPTAHTKSGLTMEPQSPYQQKLANTHVVPIPGVSRRRPLSAASTRPERPRITDTYEDSGYGDDRPPRPTSAPVHRRPRSAQSSYSRPGSTQSVSYTKKVRSAYRQQLHALVVFAFRNGSRDDCARVAAPNISMLLEACTDKLQLPKAARRIFSVDGKELLTARDITREMEVYVSTGEPFRDPLKDMQQTVNISLKSQWTMNGLVWPKDSNKKPSRTKLSRRFRGLIQSVHRRVLVFQNGRGTNSIEVVADPKKIDEFLTACTARLELGTCGRMLFDWEGNEVVDLADAPVLDDCLQNGSTPVLGPLWLSKGEGFSPKGVKEFLSGLIAYTKSKLKEAKQYQKQLEYSQDEETRDKVEIVAILSMAEKEVDDALKIVAHDIDIYSNACNRLQEQLKKIRDAADEEQNKGASYTMNHIKTVESDDKMIGRRGIKLKVHENGSNEHATEMFFNMQQALRGMESIDSKLKEKTLMQRLLDQCANSSSLAYPKKTPAIRPVPRILFDSVGKKIKSVNELQYDQEVWLSFGEPWINPSTYVVTILLDKVRAFEIDESEDGTSSSRTRAIREQLMNEDTFHHFESLKGSNWEVVNGVPDDFIKSSIRSPMEKETILSQLSSAEIDAVNSPYMRNKEGPRLLIFCEAVVGSKLQKTKQDKKEAESNEVAVSSKDIEKKKKIESTFNDLQQWIISKSGYISNKSAPQLVLGLFNNQRVVACLGHPVQGKSETKVDGFYVGVQKKEQSSISQQWTFTAEGNICSQERSDLLLTFVGSLHASEDSQVKNEEPGLACGQGLYLCACARIEGKQAASQRWALKQERFDNIGQWKFTRVDNPEWNKRALSWPVTQTGELNDKYDWPMEGFLLPYAPPTKPAGSILGTNDSQNKGFGSENGTGNSGPLRLKVMKNGLGDQSEAVIVVAPSVKKSSARDTSSSGSHSNSRHRRRTARRKNEEVSAENDTKIHCTEMTVLKQQFLAFLDQCTALLDLPFAARRLFDENGVEYCNLSTLRRDQVVYVTCGEPWSDPKLSKSEQQRHFLLANLASDVSQIRHYIQLSQANNLVLQVDHSVGLRVGAQLVINESAQMNGSNETTQDDSGFNNSVLNTMSAHEMSHKKTDELDSNKLRWPWETLVNSGAEQHEESALDGNQENRTKKLRNAEFGNSQDLFALQQFVYEDGYIACNGNRELVLSVHEQDSGHAPAVCLAKRRVEDICQRWIVTDSGLIQAKFNSQMALTVSMKHCDGATQTYIGCPVGLQRTKKVQLGRANQRWHYDSATGLIWAFHTDTVDKEITASNVANVCSYAVMGDTEIDQTCYEVELPVEKGVEQKKIWTCSSCARAMRGRYRMTKLEKSVDFVCTMGKAKELGIQQVGSFRCLNGKVDLSTHEAEHTLLTWETRLQKMRQEVGARTIAKNISAANAPYSVKILAYRNGDGRLKQPELIIGSSVPGILSQCSTRLKMTQAARRIYTSDGTMILNVDDLIEWAKDSYVKAEKRRLQREANSDKSSSNVKGDGSNFDAEDENDDKNTVALPQGTEFVVGNDSSSDRAFLDANQNCIIVPDIAPIHADGLLVSWLVFARQPGTVALDVFRRGDVELNLFNLVGQTTFTVTDGGLGELLIDISAQPIKVQRGDVIGFHIVDQSVIPYDEDDRRMSTMFYQSLENIEAYGSTVKLDSDLFAHRTYSLMANVVVDIKKKEEDSTTTVTKEATDPKAMACMKVDPPALEAMLRYPIEVFVSCGEAFFKPQKAIADSNSRRQQRSQVAAVSYELYKEKHVLRLMKGRRIEEQTPSRLNVTSDPDQPVLVEGGWQQPSIGETEKHSLVRHLQMELHKIRSAQKPKTVRMSNTSTTRRLYTQPDAKRLLIFPNGETIESAQYVWGETVSQILYNSVMRLGLNKQQKYLFTLDGRLVDKLQVVERDQILCVSSNKKFLRPKESQRFVEIKANWVRECKRRGHQASDLDKILFAGTDGTDDIENEVSPRKHEGHRHSIELKANKFTDCPTCKNKCVGEMEVDDAVQLSARRW